MSDEIIKGQVVTPDKQVVLIDKIKTEINNVSSQLKEGKYSGAVIAVLTENQKSLQKVLNNLLLKKGVVTPSETDNALNLINTTKKNRLQDNFLGFQRSTIITASVLALGGIAYFIYKRNK